MKAAVAAKKKSKPESIKVFRTEGGYSVSISPSPQPVAVFSSGYELLDWLAEYIADWESAAAEEAGESQTAAIPDKDDDDGETADS